MRYALINPRWEYEGSVYFGCREPHLALELGYARELLRREGHDAALVDAHLLGLGTEDVRRILEDFRPDFTVVLTAPTYLFWRCPQPELKVPRDLISAISGQAGRVVAIGPHGSATPVPVLKKLGADIVVMGEPEEILPKLARSSDLKGVPSVCFRDEGAVRIQGRPNETDIAALPALSWESELLKRHPHHHHRFDSTPESPGAEMETSRGCPYSCTFCAKADFRNRYRKRPLPTVLKELDSLMSSGVSYVYFIDEIFMPDERLLNALSDRGVRFGIQTRIDLWKTDTLELLGRSGCVSIEAGIESITGRGRSLLGKRCERTTDELVNLLVVARNFVPFVQATLIATVADDPEMVERWRACAERLGIWANHPVPLFPYPGTEEYRKRWGIPDSTAWERAHEYYLSIYKGGSGMQAKTTTPLKELERTE